jgi:hypothetical protein
MEISVTLFRNTEESVTTSFPESKLYEAFLLYAQYMHKLQEGQKVVMNSEKFKPLY